MIAVGSHVRPTLTNTSLLNLPIEQDVCYHVGPVTKQLVFLPMEPPFQEDFAYHLGWPSVTVCALVPSKAPFSDPSISCGTLF